MDPEWFTPNPDPTLQVVQGPLNQANWIISVADPGCLSQSPDPDFYPPRIQDLQQHQQKTKSNKNLLSYLVL